MNGLPAEALDAGGRIIDQSKTGGIPFGRRGSARCGCGWIAAYNLHLLRGESPDAQKVARQLNRLSPMSGTTGVNVFFLWLYLLFRGFRPRIMLISRRTKRSWGEAGIAMYRARRSGHYVAYQRQEGELYRYFNAVYGRQVHISDKTTFLKTYSRWPLALVIKVSKKGD